MKLRILSQVQSILVFMWLLANLSSCISVQKSEGIEDGYYSISKNIKIKKPGTDSLYSFQKKQKVYLEDHIDSLAIYPSMNKESTPIYYKITPNTSFTFKQKNPDVDLFVVPLKIRPSQNNFPAQLNTQFNACIYLGYRVDYYKMIARNNYSTSLRRTILRNGVGMGGFLGLSTVAMNPWVTQGGITSEYDGLAVSYGISAIYAVQKFNAGLAIGFDFLTDKNSDVWIYQNKPWIGVLVGLNLN